MGNSRRLTLSLDPVDYEAFESTRTKLGLERAQYIKHLMAANKDFRPPAIRDREVIKWMADVERDIKIIAMKPSVTSEEKLILLEKLDDLKNKIVG